MIKKTGTVIMIALLLSVQLFAFEDSLKVNEENSIDLVIDDVNKRTQITFKDNRNNILFEQTIDDTKKYSKRFNVELLPEGDYVVEIDDDTRTKIIPVCIGDDGIQVEESKMNEYFKPVVNEKGSLIYVNQFSPDLKPLFVSIYNDKNEVIHNEFLKGKMNLGKIFDFSQSMSGNYRIYLETNGTGYDHLVYIKN